MLAGFFYAPRQRAPLPSDRGRAPFNPEDTMEEKTRPCEICGEMIDPERVEWQPETRLCTKHAEEMRKYGGEFIVTLTESSAEIGQH